MLLKSNGEGVSLLLGYLYRQSSGETGSSINPRWEWEESSVASDATDTFGKKLNPGEKETHAQEHSVQSPMWTGNNNHCQPTQLTYPCPVHTCTRGVAYTYFCVFPQRMGQNGCQNKQSQLLVVVG